MYALYCSSRANNRSRASSRARSSLSLVRLTRPAAGGRPSGRAASRRPPGTRWPARGRTGRPAGRRWSDELVGHLRQRHLGDVHLVLRDQRQQQVERAAEVLQLDDERLGRPPRPLGTRRRAVRPDAGRLAERGPGAGPRAPQPGRLDSSRSTATPPVVRSSGSHALVTVSRRSSPVRPQPGPPAAAEC